MALTLTEYLTVVYPTPFLDVRTSPLFEASKIWIWFFCYFRSICHSSNLSQLQDDRFNSIVTDCYHSWLRTNTAYKRRIYHWCFIYHFCVQDYFSYAVHLQELLTKWIQQNCKATFNITLPTEVWAAYTGSKTKSYTPTAPWDIPS